MIIFGSEKSSKIGAGSIMLLLIGVAVVAPRPKLDCITLTKFQERFYGFVTRFYWPLDSSSIMTRGCWGREEKTENKGDSERRYCIEILSLDHYFVFFMHL